jgi:hypothetical protein
MDMIGIDVIGPLPKSKNNNRYILVIGDRWIGSGYASIQRVKWSPITKIYLLLFLLLGKGPITSIPIMSIE